MDQPTLGSREVQIAIAHFIDEARRSAQTPRSDGVLGLSAMSTVLACVSAVGEAILGRRATGEAIRVFFSHMVETDQWILPPQGTVHSNSQVGDLLVGIRNYLAHSLSLPPDIVLLPNTVADKRHELEGGEEYLRKWRLVVPAFIDAVELTVAEISRKHPGLTWDPGKKAREHKGLVDTYPVRDSHDEASNLAWNTLGVSTEGTAATATFDYLDHPDVDEDEGTSISLQTTSTG